MSVSALIRLAARAAALAADAVDGKVPGVDDVVGFLGDTAQALGVAERLRAYLTPEGAQTAEAIADAAERMKFGG